MFVRKSHYENELCEQDEQQLVSCLSELVAILRIFWNLQYERIVHDFAASKR